MTTIFHPFAVGEDGSLVRPDDQAACWSGLDAISRAGYRVIHWPCRAENDYSAGLCTYWKTDSLLIVEHDMGVTLEHVRALDTCAAGICAYAYRFEHEAGKYVWCHYHSRGYPLVEGEKGDSYATVASMGCILFHRSVQDQFEPKPNTSWRSVDTVLADQFRSVGLRVHLHWPEIDHYHAKSGTGAVKAA